MKRGPIRVKEKKKRNLKEINCLVHFKYGVNLELNGVLISGKT